MLELLAQLPQSQVYVSTLKLVLAMVLFTGWALFAQWVDKDTIAVNTYRVIWNLLTMACGIAAALLLLLLPVFLVGALAFLALQGGLTTAYVLHRNGLVPPEQRVLTAAHLKSLLQRALRGKRKPAVEEVRERVRITGADRKVVPIPEEEPGRQQFRLTQELLFDVLWRRAEVVELAPAGQVFKLRYLVDGVPGERPPLPRPDGEALLHYFKHIAGLDPAERRKPQQGRIQIALGASKQRNELVVQTGGSTAGEKLVLRLLGAQSRFKVGDLGFSDKQLETVRAIMQAPCGLVLISAPRACGLTTTLYSFTRSHDAFLENIQTLEYRKELEIDNVTQRLFVPSDERTFVGELRRLVRTDPNVVLLPEVRDRQSALVACEAAAKKQKVYVGLVAGDLLAALHKWLELARDPRLVASSLLAVLNQRLLRVLCTQCRQPYKPDAQTLRRINMPADRLLYRPPAPQYDKRGNPILCQNCQGTGYVGRTGVFSILLADEGLRKVIRAGGSPRDIQAQAVKSGALGLQQQALQKVFAGVTSIPEVVRVLRASPAGGRLAASARTPAPRTPATRPAR